MKMGSCTGRCNSLIREDCALSVQYQNVLALLLIEFDAEHFRLDQEKIGPWAHEDGVCTDYTRETRITILARQDGPDSEGPAALRIISSLSIKSLHTARPLCIIPYPLVSFLPWTLFQLASTFSLIVSPLRPFRQ
jgi:hypothetical protein